MHLLIRTAALALLCLAGITFGQNISGDSHAFDLAAAAPARVSKYGLLFKSDERKPGNAIVFYMRAIIMSSPDLEEEASKAFDALDSRNDVLFDKLAPRVFEDSHTVADFVVLAAERKECDWNPAIEERGFRSLLPELNNMRALASLLIVRATYQMRKGEIDDAIASLRVSYELAQKVGKARFSSANLLRWE